MDDLVQWLRAQLDEDERIARDPLCVNCGNRTVPLESPLGVTGYTHEGGWEGRRCPGRLVGAERVQNPARVLRGIDAKRRIVELHRPIPDPTPPFKDVDGFLCSVCTSGERLYDQNRGVLFTDLTVFPCRTLRLLASVYDDRPGYQEAWRLQS